MNSTRLLATAFAAAVVVSHAVAAPVNQVAPGTLTGTQIATFDDVPGGGAPGTNYDSIFVSGGASFAERFAGQINSPSGGFDVLSGTPTGPLSLAVGVPGQNLNIFINGTIPNPINQVLTGLGPVGFPSFAAIGEGSFAVLFTTDQSEFGFDLVGGDGGTATVNFFRRDGSLIHQIVLAALSTQGYGFQRESGVFDIAGVSVHNFDGGGIAVDNVRYDVRSGDQGGTVPEPASLALAGLALLGLAASRRRKS